MGPSGAQQCDEEALRKFGIGPMSNQSDFAEMSPSPMIRRRGPCSCPPP